MLSDEESCKNSFAEVFIHTAKKRGGGWQFTTAETKNNKKRKSKG